MSSLKMTKKRRAIYNIIKASPKPMTASEIYSILKARNEEVWLSTVYRNLEIFEDEGLVAKTELPGFQEARYIIIDNSHTHYGICTECHEVFDIIGCPFDNMTVKLKDKGFVITDHRLAVYGLCSKCAKN